MALKSTLKPKSVRALKSRIVVKSKPAKVTKYKDKTTKLYTSRTYNIKALATRGGQGIKFKSKLFKIIISISGGESLSSNNINIKDDNKNKLIKV